MEVVQINTDLMRGGFPLTVYNRTREKAEGIAAEGARIADSPAEAADGAEVVISMLADDDVSRSVWSGPGGALSRVREGALLIESGTVSLEWVRELGAEASRLGAALLDAPVTGSRDQAAEGELLFPRRRRRGRPRASAPGSRCHEPGRLARGATWERVDPQAGEQLPVRSAGGSLAEAVAMVERSGIDRDTALSVLTGGAPGSPLVKALSTRMIAADYAPHFALALMVKDLRYAAGEGQRIGLELETARAARTVMQRAVEGGYGEHDIAVVEQFRKG